MDTKIKRNIRIIYLFSFFWPAMVLLPVIVPFFNSRGLSLADVFYLQAIFSLVIVLLEVPSGYLADVLGRRNALVIGSAFHAIGFSIMVMAEGFWNLVFADAMLGIGISMLSGADISLLYDSQQALNHSLKKKSAGIATMRSLKSSAEGIAALASSAILFVWTFDDLVIVNAAIGWVPFVLSLFLIEPPYERMAKTAVGGNLKRVLIRLFVEDELLKLICLSITFFSLATFYVVWLFQPYWQDAGIGIAWFGVLWAAQSFTVALASSTCIALEERFGAKPLLIAIGILPPLGYFGMALLGPLGGVLIGFAFFLSRGWNQVLLTDALNRRVPSSYRATANSMTSFMFRIVFIVTGPLVGLLIHYQGMTITLTVLGVVTAGLFFVLMLPFLKLVAKRDSNQNSEVVIKT